MSGWAVLGWCGIAAIGLVILGMSAGLVIVMIKGALRA